MLSLSEGVPCNKNEATECQTTDESWNLATSTCHKPMADSISFCLKCIILKTVQISNSGILYTFFIVS